MHPIRINVDVLHLDDEKLAMTLAASNANDPRCWVEKDESVYIEPGKAGEKFPVFLELESNVPIECIGFAKRAADLKFYRQKGHCGGCFFLEADIDPSGTKSLLIRNDGPGTDPPTEYHFEILFLNGRKPAGIDPQIYNQGVGETPSWWSRLWAWLRS